MNKFHAGCILLAVLIGLAVAAPTISPADPYTINMTEKLQDSSWLHPMGTDQLGRDLFSRVLYAARISFMATLVVMSTCLVIGTVVGCVAGYFGGLVDEVLMRLVDMLMAFPSFLLPIAITGLLGSSMSNVILALSLTTWTGYARMVRSSVLSVKQQLYVEVADVMGGSRLNVIKDHVIPNAIHPLIVYAAMHSGHTILAISGFGFMGLGAQPPTPEWGTMLNEAMTFMGHQPNLFVFPGGAIMMTVLSFNLLGEGLLDMMDPKQQKEVKI
ncbi:MAG: ABC transporter permease [Pseudomonadota bacterium]